MATQVADVRGRRDRRLVVLVSDKEKREIEFRAREADMSVSDWLRTVGREFAMPTAAEAEQLRDLLEQLREANVRTDASHESLLESEKRWAEFDETAYKAKIEALMERHWGDPGAVMKIIQGELRDLEAA